MPCIKIQGCCIPSDMKLCVPESRSLLVSPGNQLVGLDAVDELLDGGLGLLAAHVLDDAPQVIFYDLEGKQEWGRS